MKILVADDDPVSRITLSAILDMLGYSVLVAEDGNQAWESLCRPDAPPIAILDWMMPGLSGIEVCQRVRAREREQSPYLVILTSRDMKIDVLEALDAGADEFLTKPVDPAELRVRMAVGKRIVTLQQSLADRVRQLQKALDQVETLEGIIPICSYCKKIRNDQQYWLQVEQYISDRTKATFSHGICPECLERHVRPELDELKNRNRDSQFET